MTQQLDAMHWSIPYFAFITDCVIIYNISSYVFCITQDGSEGMSHVVNFAGGMFKHSYLNVQNVPQLPSSVYKTLKLKSI